MKSFFQKCFKRPVMHGILCTKHSIGYVPLPKVANTSIKHAMFELEHGTRFTTAATGVAHIHHYYRKQAQIEHAAFRFVVVRDPIKRFLSAFSNRVIHHRELSEESIRAVAENRKHLNLQPSQFVFDPDLSLFIDQLENYQRIPSILVHTQPITPLVQDLGLFTKVYGIESMAQAQADLSAIAQKPVCFRHAQSGGPKLHVSCLSAAQLEKLRCYFAEDYRLLEPFYPFDRLWREWKEKGGQ
jgi:hypothetical protein